jgi:two-component system sensor histidine kinase HydH
MAIASTSARARGRRRRQLHPAPSDGLEDLRGLPLFAAVVAHELRNPLSAVKIALQTLERHAALPPKDDTRLRIALREVATIERVLTDVVDWARPPEMRLEKVEVREIVECALGRAAPTVESTGVRVETDVPPGAAAVQADRTHLSEALTELLRNAAEASQRGGVVRITVTQNERETLFTVTDEGRSLSDEDCQRAFDPFFSRRARGIGLGLPRARETAYRHGGDITLSRRLAGGARATLRLPREAAP